MRVAAAAATVSVAAAAGMAGRVVVWALVAPATAAEEEETETAEEVGETEAAEEVGETGEEVAMEVVAGATARHHILQSRSLPC